MPRGNTVTDEDLAAFDRAHGTAPPTDDWPEPADIRSPADSEPYPVEHFPPVAREAIEEYSRFGRQPLPMVAGSALAQMALAAQGLADVARDAQLRSCLSLYLMVVAQSGERKSAADRQFSRAARAWVRKACEERLPEFQRSAAMATDHKVRAEGVKARIKAIAAKEDPESVAEHERLRQRLVELEQNPVLQIPLPVHAYEDVNAASLAYALATGWPSAGLFSDEAGAVIGSQGLNEEGATGLLSLLNIAWDARDYVPTRKQAATAALRGRRFSAFLMFQPSLLPKLIEKGARNLGVLARFLISAPESTMGSRLYVEPPETWHALDAFDAHIVRLLEHELPVDKTGPDKGLLMRLDPPVMRLETTAKRVWVEFHDSIERELCQFGEFAEVADIASKAAENAARIAGVFKLFDQGRYGAQVETRYVQAGAAVAGWHLSEARRVFLDVDAPPEVLDARELAQWLAGRGREITDSSGVPIIDQAGMLAVREITRWGPNRVRDRTRRDDAIEKLEEAGHLRRSKRGREACVRINPKLWAVE
jgi:putative DNA primase/helicase